MYFEGNIPQRAQEEIQRSQQDILLLKGHQVPLSREASAEVQRHPVLREENPKGQNEAGEIRHEQVGSKQAQVHDRPHPQGKIPALPGRRCGLRRRDVPSNSVQQPAEARVTQDQA